MKKKILVIFFFIIKTIFLNSLDNTSDIPIDWKDRSSSFVNESMGRFLSNANLQELKSMAQSLKVEAQDDINSYKKALAAYYDVTLIEPDPPKKGDQIVLERAGELKMFKLQEDDEEHLHITGRVKLVIKSKDGDQIVEADNMDVDLKHKEIMGTGNVYFKDKGLEFAGEQFYFNFEVKRGVLFNGRTKILESGSSGLKDAYFIGERIIQSNEEDAILENGSLTTCNRQNPHYHIRVTKLWISQKGEWGLLNGIVFIGPVPFLYMPVFYHPRDLIINPAIGYLSREGWYLNTTFYVLGEKVEIKRDETDIMGIEKSRAAPSNEKLYFRLSSADVRNYLDDFYNRDFYKKNPSFKIYPKFNYIDFALRIFGDAYTNLGFYVGGYYYMNFDHPVAPFKFSYLGDAGFSRLLWQQTINSDIYVPYNPADKVKVYDGNTENTYYYPGANPLTPRTSQWAKFEGNVKGKYTNFKYDAQFEYASDNYYFSDFYNRRLSFSYLDLLSDTLKFNIEFQGQSMSNFETKKNKNSMIAKPTLNTYIKLGFNPTKYPDIYGLKIIDSIDLSTNVDLGFRVIQMKPYEPTVANGKVDNPKYIRYMIDTFTVPNVSYKMSGTLFDYKTIADMPKKIVKDKIDKETKKFDYSKLTEKIDDFMKLHPDPTSDTSSNPDATSDATTDKNKIDYRSLVVFFSKKGETSIVDLTKTNLEYSDPVGIDGYKFIGRPPAEESNIVRGFQQFETPNNIALGGTATSQALTLDYFGFNLGYTFQDELNNKFKFAYNEGVDNTPEYDTVEKVLTGNFNPETITESFNINNSMTFTLKGVYHALKIGSGGGILSGIPLVTFYYRKDFDILSVYNDYLLNNFPAQTEQERDKMVFDREKQNKTNSEISVYYEDTINNDLSFGQYVLSGTQISTNVKVRLFRFSEIKEYNYTKLNGLNSGNAMYSPIDPLFYDTDVNMIYDKINNFYTRFTLKSNLIPKGNPNTLSVGVGPKINWVIPSTNMTILKNELWQDESNDVIYKNSSGTESYEAEAREYIYFYNKNGKKNLNDKINEFFAEENFWYGPKNYRKMLEDLTFTLNYSFRKDNIDYVRIDDTFKIKFENIGEFSRGDLSSDTISILPTIVYPDNSFSIGFFNDMFKYTNTLVFTKVLDTNYVYYGKLSSSDRLLDRYNIMTFSDLNIITFTLKGDLFPVKLPKGNWATFASNTEFRYDKNIVWQKNPEFNTFYLNSQTFTLSLFMDILKMSISFKAFDFQYTGYGFTLDHATINVGYTVTEIPTLFNFLKIVLAPSISYTFYVNNTNYYTSKTLQSINNNYYQNNTLYLSFALSLIIGESTDFETKLTFEMKNYNKKMYTYYTPDGLTKFFEDLRDSFNFSDIEKRRSTNFKLDTILVKLEHNLHDWQLVFTYMGQQERRDNAKKYYWENTFKFEVVWKLDSENQLMKMFNKTKVSSSYEKGEWKQPVLSLDPDSK